MKYRDQFRPRGERLESRQLLAADLVISELMARNGATLQDGFGNTSDWIEIQNTSDEVIDLAGYHLTDNRRRPDKWTFPDSTPLEPGSYLLLFASGEDTKDPHGHWHTNFKLDADGEYLALLDSSFRVLSAYGSLVEDYPRQFPDIAYGVGQPGHFLATDVPRVIPAGQSGTVTSDLSIQGLPGTITHVSVTLQITHEWVDDLDVFLVSQSGTRIELLSDVGGSGDNFVRTTLDDDASMSIRDGQAPFTGRYRPEGSLSQLVGEDPNGLWRLEIHDDFAAVGGELESWSLTIETDQGDASTVGYLEFPTPGMANAIAWVDYVRDTRFSVDRGFFEQPFEVQLATSTAGATIYYTTDGSPPGPDNPNALPYSQPLLIENTTTLRPERCGPDGFRGPSAPKPISSWRR